MFVNWENIDFVRLKGEKKCSKNSFKGFIIIIIYLVERCSIKKIFRLIQSTKDLERGYRLIAILLKIEKLKIEQNSCKRKKT